MTGRCWKSEPAKQHKKNGSQHHHAELVLPRKEIRSGILLSWKWSDHIYSSLQVWFFVSWRDHEKASEKAVGIEEENFRRSSPLALRPTTPNRFHEASAILARDRSHQSFLHSLRSRANPSLKASRTNQPTLTNPTKKCPPTIPPPSPIPKTPSPIFAKSTLFPLARLLTSFWRTRRMRWSPTMKRTLVPKISSSSATAPM